MIENVDIIEGLIVGRVRPRIYAFSTNTVPSFLKVGDTYRPVARRLQEWRAHYPDLEKHFEGAASVSDDTYFRDHSVHSFLEHELGRSRLQAEDLPAPTYYSREFFAGAQPEDVDAAIKDIQDDHSENRGRYTFYDARAHLPVTYQHVRGEDWQLRPNQHAAVDSFVDAVAQGRTNLLMYAVMRFGKTFTSLMCANHLGARTVLVVSAKADVKGEWKKTVESAGNFAGYRFLDAEALLADPSAITDAPADHGCAVVFLTLQDLQGVELKDKHKEVFGREIDLLIIDETHFGARAEKYGMVLRDPKQPVERPSVRDGDDHVELDDAQQQLKVLDARVRLHLSGSPYRILMGNEFAVGDVIAFVQFADIVREQEAWDIEHPDKDEWENPYFGFPQMVRFAFNPNQSSRDKLAALRDSGLPYALSALLQPQSIIRDATGGAHKKFVHEAEILDLLRVIDGSQQDQNMLGFLDYDKIKQGQMCRHLVMVLPYRASCDAMQDLIAEHAEEFRNLHDYEILNISGVEDPTRFATPERVKATIAKAESEGRKTLTLTVNRMLTGSTVEQWDTMLYLRDTASPQEYDQATFRLQSPHVRLLGSDKVHEVIKENLKPQTLLVDFDPLRLFRIQELRSLMSNAADREGAGNSDLGERLRQDLRISPVITMNAGRLGKVAPSDILAAVSQYNLGRSIADEARDVPVDLGVLDVDAIRKVIELQAELGSRNGLTINAVEGEETDLNLDDEEGPQPPPPPPGPDPVPPRPGTTGGADEARTLERKLQTYYQRILFFAMLTPDPVASLQDVVGVIEEVQNHRIARNLGLDPTILAALLEAFDPFKLNSLDYKILNISRLAREESLTPVARAGRALEKFTRMSDAEVRTPLWLCREMVGRIPGDRLRALVERGERVLDMASKSGEFALAFYERLTGELGVDPQVASSAMYSLPTSSIAYEFTRRFYEILGIDVANIAGGLTSYDLLAQTVAGEAVDLGDVFKKEGAPVKFGVVVGNPPYQDRDGGAQQSARPIYQLFVAAAAALDPQYMSFVIPSRWYAGGKGLGEFRDTMLSDPRISELHDFPRPEAVFPETNNRGGVCYFVRDAGYDALAAGGTRVLTRDAQDVEVEAIRPLDSFGMGMFLRDSKGVGIVEKVVGSVGFASFEDHVSSRKPFGIEGNIVRSPEFYETSQGLTDPVLCYGKAKEVGYVERDLVRAHRDWVAKWKVLTPYANNIGTELSDDNQNAFVVAPGSVCSETYIVMGAGLDLTEVSARNLAAYVRSKFARFLHAKAKVSQHGTKATYRFVPQVDVSTDSPIDWDAPAEQVDEQLFDMFALTGEEREHIRTSIR